MKQAWFDGKNALVTGSSSGIGRATAEGLGARGASVTVNYPNDAQAAAAEEIVSAIRSDGGKAIAVKADLTRMDAIPSLFDEAERAFGPLDMVVSNVGGNLKRLKIEEVTEEDFDAGMAFNAKSQFFVLQQAARRVRDGGRIVATSSSTVTLAYPGIG